MGKRVYLNKEKTDDMTKKLNEYFMRTVKIPRMQRGSKQELESLISEEALLLARYIRGEKEGRVPRIAVPLAS